MGTGYIAQWEIICLANTRPLVSPPVPKRRGKNTRKINYKICLYNITYIRIGFKNPKKH